MRADMVAHNMTKCSFVRAVLMSSLLAFSAQNAAAQTVGTFRWQALPFCNVITLTVVQVGTVFTLDGFDDQCGAATRASVVGTAFFNPDGSVGIGLTMIATPGGGPVHMDVALSLATISGPWRDSAGNSGTFAFTTSTGTGGPPRPLGHGIGAGAIDPTEVQQRITGMCEAGSAVRSINEDGTVVCEQAGDITAVTAGPGLTGSAASGAATLAVAIAGPGTELTAAKSDHQHQLPGNGNIGVGPDALRDTTTGTFNSAFGAAALEHNTTGRRNTAIGSGALYANSTGSFNTSIGDFSGLGATTGFRNTFVGADANPGNGALVNASAFGAEAQVDISNALVLGSIDGVNSATSNVKVGIGTTTPAFPLHVVSTGGRNGRIQVGSMNPWETDERRIVSFGDGLVGSVYAGEEDANDRLVLRGRTGVRFKADQNQAVAPDEDNTLRLGGTGNRWIAVYAIDGIVQTSDARLKRNIADLDYGISAVLKLRPVSFRWKDRDDGSTNLGLLAQEVEDVIPEAVVHGIDPDEPLGMSYGSLVPVLIKAIQEQQSELERQSARIDAVAPPSAAAQLLGGQLAIPVLPAVDPVAFTLCTPEGPGSTQKCNGLGFPASYKVPPGKRLIIEQVAGSCGGDADQDETTEATIVAQTAGVIVAHPISGVLLPPGLAVRIPLTLTRIYADPQSLVTIGLTGVGGFSNRWCWLRFSGQLVKP